MTVVSALKEYIESDGKEQRGHSGAGVGAVTGRINQPYKEQQKRKIPSRGTAWSPLESERGKVQRYIRASSYRRMQTSFRESELYFMYDCGITFSHDFQLRPCVKQDKQKFSSYRHLETLDKMAILFSKTKCKTELRKNKGRVPGACEQKSKY